MNIDDLANHILSALDEGLIQALYRLASVEPSEVLAELSGPDGPPSSIEQVASLPVELIDPVATRYIREARRAAALSGASLGFGGWMGVPPGLMHLVVLLLRLSQRLAVAYGVDFRTSRGEIELWKALAHGVGASVDWEGTEAELMRRLPVVVTGTGTFTNPLLVKAAQAVLMRVAVTAGTRVTRFVPVVGAGSGAVLNYLEVHRVGRRLKETWRSRHAIAGFKPSDALVVEILQG
jgi:hypothetical protein